MKKIVITILLIISLALIGKNQTLASFEKVDHPNNKFGIHLAVISDEDLQDAANLVNSRGGDWGYVTIVIGEKDRNREKWQTAFDKMRELHLIPIVRLATSLEKDSWRRPTKQDAQAWADFLESLNWVTKNRYVVLFNEPNQAKEWGGKVDPEDYSKVVLEFAKKLKEKNPNFFIMLAGLDAAAPHNLPDFEDEELFLYKMFTSLPNWGQELIGYLDGWASHSYPNHGFVGSPYDWGRNSIRTYLWETNLLGKFNIKNSLPIFITETGWPHAEGLNYNPKFFPQERVSENYRLYFNQLTTDPKVIAITPFIFNYQDGLFDHFSWRKLGNQGFYPQYETVRQISKTKGEPEQNQNLVIIGSLPEKLIKNSTYQIPIAVKNEGQAIWSQKDGYSLSFASSTLGLDHLFSDFTKLKPEDQETIQLYLKTSDELKKFNLSLVVSKNGQPVSNQYAWSLEVVPTINLQFQINLFPKVKSEERDFKILIYDSKDEVVFEKTGIEVQNNTGQIEEINNLEIGEKYRVVLLKPYYLPRQKFLVVQEKNNQIVFDKMLPLDFNLDGKFSFGDFISAFTKLKLRSLWQLF